MRVVWFLLLVIMIGKLLFSSIFSYLIFGTELINSLMILNKFSGLIFYVTHFCSFILAAILAQKFLTFFKNKKTNFFVMLIFFGLLSISTFLVYFMAFGQLILIIGFFAFLAYTSIDIFKFGKKYSI